MHRNSSFPIDFANNHVDKTFHFATLGKANWIARLHTPIYTSRNSRLIFLECLVAQQDCNTLSYWTVTLFRTLKNLKLPQLCIASVRPCYFTYDKTIFSMFCYETRINLRQSVSILSNLNFQFSKTHQHFSTTNPPELHGSLTKLTCCRCTFWRRQPGDTHAPERPSHMSARQDMHYISSSFKANQNILRDFFQTHGFTSTATKL